MRIFDDFGFLSKLDFAWLNFNLDEKSHSIWALQSNSKATPKPPQNYCPIESHIHFQVNCPRITQQTNS